MNEFKTITDELINIYTTKDDKYGNSLQHVSISTFVDIIMSKQMRCLNIYDTNTQSVNDETIIDTMYSIANYSAICLSSMSDFKIEPIYIESLEIMNDKNKDYNSAWLRYDNLTFIELIGIKVNRMKNECSKPNNQDIDVIKDAMYDIINYAMMYINKNTNKTT